MSPTSDPDRFRDPRSTRYDYLDAILVRCPACAHLADVVPRPDTAAAADTGTAPGPSIWAPRRLVCRHCGKAKDRERSVLAFHPDRREPATDPYFDVRLWLQSETRHGWVWAYNPEHLDLIRRFVQASLREGIPWHDHGRKMTVVARLPAWMKRARNREEVLRAISRIDATLLRA